MPKNQKSLISRFFEPARTYRHSVRARHPRKVIKITDFKLFGIGNPRKVKHQTTNNEHQTTNNEQRTTKQQPLHRQEIILYQPDEQSTAIDVRVENETVWLTQAQMVELFQSTKQNISLHINNVYKEGELQRDTTVKEYLTVQQEGSRQVKRKIIYYNLDVIISVGYRVKSHRGTQFSPDNYREGQ